MVEVLVSLGIIFATLLVLAFSMFSSFASVGFSRQRTQASALANQTIEQIRALPFDMLFMSQPDLAGASDTQIQPCATPVGSYCFLNATGRQIPSATFAATLAHTPLFPAHVSTQPGTPGTTVYTIKSYVTIDPTDTTGQTKIATVQVSWTPPQIGGVQPNLQVESKIYTSPFSENPPGATTTTTVAAVHNYNANAQSQPGTISVTGNVLNLLGGNAVNVTFALPSAKSFLSGNTSVGTSTGPDTAGTAASGITAGVTVLNTPSAQASATSPNGAATQVDHKTQTPTIVGSIPSSLTQGLNVLGSTITAGVAVGQVSTADALAASTASSSLNVPSGSGVIPGNNLGYGRSAAVQTGALSSDLALTLVGLPLLNLGLVSLVPTGNANPPGPDMATVEQKGPSNVPLAQTFNASASKSFTNLSILSGLPGIPGGTLISLTGFRAQASACAGPGSCSPATATQAGQLVIAGLAPITLAASPAPISIGTCPAVPICIPAVNVITGILNIAVTANVTIGASTTTGTSSGNVASPVSAHVHLLIGTALGPIVDLNIVLDLGTVTTSALYS